MDVKELIQQIDIVDFISQYVDLEEKGGEFWGISPFTDPPEHTPSFSVRRETNTWYDFSSGQGGNAYTFIKLYLKCSGTEAIEHLQKFAGLEGAEITKKPKMSAVLVAKAFARPVQRVKEDKTTVLPPDVMDRYEKNPEKLSLWRDEGISDASMERFQVRYDRFANAIVYPIRDPDGKIVNIGGRTLDPHFKEKGLRKYFYLKPWGTLKTIYGLAENREEILRKREIILFEGCKSVMKADTWGIRNCGAILTSHLSNEQMKLLIKLGCRVVFALDKEILIQQDHNIQRLKRFTNVEFLFDTQRLLEEKDSPADKGEEVFRKLYERRLRYR